MCRWVGGSRGTPSVDANQDVMMTMAEQVNGQTTISFTRPRVTGDSAPTDLSLDGAVYFLWATGNEINYFANQAGSIAYHQASRGASNQMIQLPSAAECPPVGKRIILLSCPSTHAVFVHTG